MRKTVYRPYFLMMAIVSVVMMFLAYYSMGVVDRWKCRESASRRLEYISELFDSNTKDSERITEEIYSDYKSRSRIVAIMLSKNTDTMKNDVYFEEMRVAIGAATIDVSDSRGIIVYSTNPSKEKQKVRDEFLYAIQDKVFSEALISGSGKDTCVVTGSSRLDSDGVIQIEYSPGSAQHLLEISDPSGLLTGVPFMEGGSLAVFDTESYEYISHTDPELNGVNVQYPKELFEDEKGSFDSEFEGEDVFIQYKKHGRYIIMVIQPFSDIYSRRNSVVLWIAASLGTTVIVTLLVARNKILLYRARNKSK